MNSKKISRRNLFKVSAIAGGGLMLKLSLPANALEDGATTLVKSSELNFYVTNCIGWSNHHLCA